MRIKELDYLKGVMIIFVITFHLVYFEHLYPYAKQVGMRCEYRLCFHETN